MSGRAFESLFQMPCSLLEGTAAGNSEGPTTSSLGDLRASKAAVYDFWTTRCTNCPAALDRLDAMARERPSVAFVGVNIDNAVKAEEMVLEAKSEGRWASLTHVHLSEDEKEMAKELLGMRTVPFYVIVSEVGAVLRHGNATAVSLTSVEALDSVLAGEQKEILPTLANTSSSTSASTTDKKTKTVSDNPARDCEGGVCRLPRRAKPSPPKPDTAPPTSAGTADTAVAVAGEMAALAIATTPAPTTTIPSSLPEQPLPPAPANPSAVVCEGDVCRLVRKKKDPVVAAKERGGETSAAKNDGKPGAAPAPAATAARAGMECEGGVCRLVRTKGAETTTTKKNSAEKTKGVEASPLGPGDPMPTLRVMQLDGGHMKSLDEIRAGGAAVLDFWTTRCVRCPAALDALEMLAAKSTDGTKYVSVNLDDLEGARQIVSNGRWPSMSHVFAGRDEDSEVLESFKARAALKSVPFYVVIAADGTVDQIGGPRAVTLGKTNPAVPAPPATAAVPEPTSAPATAPKSSAFTMDEEF